jgi:hypothetical protein
LLGVLPSARSHGTGPCCRLPPVEKSGIVINWTRLCEDDFKASVVADGISFSVETARWYPADYYPRHVKTWLITTIQNIFVRVPSFPQLVAFGSSRLSTGPNDTQDKGKDMQSVVGYIYGEPRKQIYQQKKKQKVGILSIAENRPDPVRPKRPCLAHSPMSVRLFIQIRQKKTPMPLCL